MLLVVKDLPMDFVRGGDLTSHLREVVFFGISLHRSFYITCININCEIGKDMLDCDQVSDQVSDAEVLLWSIVAILFTLLIS
jgi:hypothetical protein